MRLAGSDTMRREGFWQRLCLEPWLFGLLLLLSLVGVATVYSATGGDGAAAWAQTKRLLLGLVALLLVARCPPQWFHGLALPGYGLCLLLLVWLLPPLLPLLLLWLLLLLLLLLLQLLLLLL